VIVIVIFGAAGIVMIIWGWRGAAVASEPRCAQCGYDLRGVADLKIARCSECGGELGRHGAVSRSAFQRRPKRIMAGIVVLGLPWLLILIAMVLRFIGPNGERFRSNQSIIVSLLNDPNPAWQWPELALRLRSGRLGKAEASPAVNEFVAEVQNRREKNGPLFWKDFFQAADRAGAIDPDQYLKIAQAYYGKVPTVTLHSPVQATNAPSGFSVSTVNHWQLPGNELVCAVRRISLAAGSTAPVKSPIPSPGAPPASENLVDASGNWIAPPNVLPGRYQATFVVDMGLVPAAGRSGFMAGLPGQAPPRARWTESVTLPLDISAASGAGNGPTRAVALETDPEFDPKKTGAISVVAARALCYADRAVVIVSFKIDHLPINCFLNAEIKAGDERYSKPDQSYLYLVGRSYDSGIAGEFDSLPTEIHTVDLVLRPSPENMKAFIGYDPFWGNPISFENIELKRQSFPFRLPVNHSKPTTQTQPATAPANASPFPEK